MFCAPWHRSVSTDSQPSFSSSTWKRGGVWMSKPVMKSQERLKIEAKLLLSDNRIGSYICSVDWHNNEWPWVTVNVRIARYLCGSWVSCFAKDIYSIQAEMFSYKDARNRRTDSHRLSNCSRISVALRHRHRPICFQSINQPLNQTWRPVHDASPSLCRFYVVTECASRDYYAVTVLLHNALCLDILVPQRFSETHKSHSTLQAVTFSSK